MNVIGLGLGQSASQFLGLGFLPGEPAPGASAAEIWAYVLSNGKTAGQTAVETHAMLTAMTALLADCPANLLMVLRLLRNKQITDPNTGVFTIYADDSVTPLLQGNLFEDAAGATPYRGQGAERREKLS